MTSITSTSQTYSGLMDTPVVSSAPAWGNASTQSTLPYRLPPFAIGAVVGVALVLPFFTVGTSTTIVDQRPTLRHATPNPSLATAGLRSTTEQLQIISHVLGLSKSELAKVMRIARPSLYDWLNGKSEPKDENARRLSTITGIVNRVTHGDSQRVFSLFVTNPLEDGEPSILEYLQREVLESTLIEGLLATALERTVLRDQRLAKFERETRTVRQSPALREARLDRNLTLAEWDKV